MAVGISLERIPSPGASPVAGNSASSKSLVNDYAKLAVPNLSTRDRMAIAILGLIYTNEVSHDYRTNHGGLIKDALLWTRGLSQFDFWSAMAGVEWTSGNETDTALGSDVPTMMSSARDLRELQEDQLLRIYVFLRAQLLT